MSTEAPKEFLGSLTSILNRGSIHSATDQIDGKKHDLIPVGLVMVVNIF